MSILNDLKQSDRTFIIAEIGQNHQGDLDIAKQLIKTAKECGVDCVKFQKTCLEEKFTKDALETPYRGPHSWGRTYGEHKAFLEFSPEQFADLQRYAKDQNILFSASAMDEKSLEFLASLNLPFIKIGSGDSNNFPLIKKAAKTHIPLIISTGMIDLETTRKIYQTVSNYHNNFALLHCVSSYPTPYDQINLRVILELQKQFPDIVIGYSGHEIGNHISMGAVALGAKIIERHITLDKSLKGSDHVCSLEPNELRSLVEGVRVVEQGLGLPVKIRQKCEEACYGKLGKSLVYARGLPKGSILNKEDVKVKVSKPKGVDAARYEDVLGKQLVKCVEIDQPVLFKHFNIIL